MTTYLPAVAGAAALIVPAALAVWGRVRYGSATRAALYRRATPDPAPAGPPARS